MPLKLCSVWISEFGIGPGMSPVILLCVGMCGKHLVCVAFSVYCWFLVQVPVSKFQELRYNVALILKEMNDLEKRSILQIQDWCITQWLCRILHFWDLAYFSYYTKSHSFIRLWKMIIIACQDNRSELTGHAAHWWPFWRRHTAFTYQQIDKVKIFHAFLAVLSTVLLTSLIVEGPRETPNYKHIEVKAQMFTKWLFNLLSFV